MNRLFVKLTNGARGLGVYGRGSFKPPVKGSGR
jgi:hypothetical protein